MDLPPLLCNNKLPWRRSAQKEESKVAFGIFSRRRPDPRIAAYAEFLDFLESRSAFLAQKCVYEYCRARSGINWDKLMLEADFLAAYEISRWEAFGAALADLVVYLEGQLRPADTRLHARLVDRLIVAAALVLARHPVPAHKPEGWGTEIAQLRERLNTTQLGQPLAAAEVSKTSGARIYATLPLHRDMTRHDRELVTNAVRFNFSRIASDLEQQLDVEPLLRELLADNPPQGH
jgi:hypothetical protein